MVLTPCLRELRSISIDISVDLLPSSILGRKWLCISSMVSLLSYYDRHIITDRSGRFNLIFANGCVKIAAELSAFLYQMQGAFLRF